MGNAAGKGSEALKDAVQTMLEVPLTGTNSAASSEFAGGQGQQDGEGNDEDQEEEEDEIWQSVFGCDLEEGEFYEELAASDMTAMAVMQPDNIKLLARKALANLSSYLEARQTSPSMDVVRASVRVLTRVVPALLSDPALHAWCWKRRKLSYLLAYIEETPEEAGDESGGWRSPGRDGSEGSPQSGKTPPQSQDGDGGKSKREEERGDGGFCVCFASVALHTTINLLSFPGFSVDQEAGDWDDYYTPIPDVHYAIKETSVIWAPGVAVTEHNMRQVTSLDANRVEALRLLLALLSLPLYLDTPSPVDWSRLAQGNEGGSLQPSDDASGSSSPGIPYPLPPPPANASSSSSPSSPPPPPRDPKKLQPCEATTLPGVPLRNPVAVLATSRHLPFCNELFYSLLNVAVVSSDGDSGAGGGRGRWATAAGILQRFGLADRSGVAGGEEGRRSQSLVEWSLQVLALLLQHGRPYGELLKKRGIFLAETGATPVFGSVPRPVEVNAEMDPGYNAHRRCVFVIHSDEDLDSIAAGLLRYVNNARLGKSRSNGSFMSTHQEALIIFSTFVHDNPWFVPRLAASEEFVRGTAVCVCHFLEAAVGSMMDDEQIADAVSVAAAAPDGEEQGQQQAQERRGEFSELGFGGGGAGEGVRGGARADQNNTLLGEEVGLMVLLSRLLLTLSENELFMAMLVDMPAGGGVGRRGEFSAPEMESDPGATMMEVVVKLAAWALARAPGGIGLASPALAAVARNACPFLTAGMRKQTAEWMLNALDVHVGNASALPTSTTAGKYEGDGDGMGEGEGRGGAGDPVVSGVSTSLEVASILLEGLAAALAFHHEEQGELVMAMIRHAGPAPSTPGMSTTPAPAAGGGVLRRLAVLGGLCEGDTGSEHSAHRTSCLRRNDTSWFKVSGAKAAPWEGWAMCRVIWPMLAGVSTVQSAESVWNDEQERSVMRMLMAEARREVLRPAGLCPPWAGEEDGGSGEDTGYGRGGKNEGRGVPARGSSNPVTPTKGLVERGTALIAGAFSPGGNSNSTNTTPSKPSAVSDPDLVESGLQPTVSSPASPVPSDLQAVVGSAEKRDVGQRTIGAIRGGGEEGREAFVGQRGTGVDEEGRALGVKKVTAVEEPWQSIYLWSLLFVKTATSDVKLFDSRTVRLFEVIDEQDDENDADDTENDSGEHHGIEMGGHGYGSSSSSSNNNSSNSNSGDAHDGVRRENYRSDFRGVDQDEAEGRDGDDGDPATLDEESFFYSGGGGPHDTANRVDDRDHLAREGARVEALV